ncbi:PhzF family phenazine biosynthesis protein [Clostridium chromiireducens]|uniref:PhzF family phenazine biosynthesis protein n=1 Tax=Clostridium chromiireducens TaxID=225345 RepID=UPI003AF7A9B3
MVIKKFYVINSFGDKSFQGNPAAIFLDASSLDTIKMQSIAKQLNLIETVFIFNNQDDLSFDFQLRYFTPTQELPLAGHPTIAAFIALEASSLINVAEKSKYRIKTEAGIQEMTVCKEQNDLIVMMEAKVPVFYPVVSDKFKVAKVLGLDVSDIMDELPIQPVDTGLGHLIIPIKSLESLMKVKRNVNELKELCEKLNVREVQVFTLETYRKEFDIHTRNICPREGIEDPGCGIGNAALGAYLLKNKYIGKQEIRIKAEQGAIVNMPCIIEIHAYETGDEINVQVGGKGKIMIKGEFFIE